jgi:hypothetical protein
MPEGPLTHPLDATNAIQALEVNDQSRKTKRSDEFIGKPSRQNDV